MQKLILVVEDDSDVLGIIEDILTNNSYRVISASNGKEAVTILQTETPDLILSDILMPCMNGFELLKFVQNSKHTEHIPFVFLTAKTSNSDMRTGMGLGADDYLIKPFRVVELLEMLAVRLKKREAINEQFNKIKENIAFSVEHELRTPLTPIIGYSGMMNEDVQSLTTEEIKDMSAIILKSALRLHSRIEKFVLFSSLQYELTGLNPNIINNTAEDIEDLVNIIAKEERKIKDGVIELESVIEKSQLKINESCLGICIKELIENACKFSNSNSMIKITGENKSEFYELSFENTGMEFNFNQIINITLFNKQDPSFIGSGLGLPIVKKIAEYFSGRLKIVTNKQKHTIVSIQIPIAKN
ncbi:MAG: response regulator [Ignavibacteria bacterium]